MANKKDFNKYKANTLVRGKTKEGYTIYFLVISSYKSNNRKALIVLHDERINRNVNNLGELYEFQLGMLFEFQLNNESSEAITQWKECISSEAVGLMQDILSPIKD